MSIIKSLTQRNPRAITEPVVAAEARYLTDGRRLFRRTSAPRRCPAGFVWLEDCESLTVVLATTGEVGELTAVYATDEDEIGGQP
jgi:hypothetical protein